MTYDQIRAEIAAGRWHPVGRKVVSTTVPWAQLSGPARWWAAVGESGSGAMLDWVTSLLACGLEGWRETIVHVSVPKGTRIRQLPGVRVHQRRRLGPLLTAGIARTVPEVAVLPAAELATSDRQALTLLAMTVQQRLTPAARVLTQWRVTTRHRRRALLSTAIPLVCDGAHALGEIDFALDCRRRGLPEPSRQEVRVTPQGMAYLDVWFERYGVHVEINGAHHYAKLAPLADALRHNTRALAGEITLQIPVLGLVLDSEAFLDQVEQALRLRGWRRS